MSNLMTIEGKVVGFNTIEYKGSIVKCFVNGMAETVAPQPLDLSAYVGQVVHINGDLHGELWSAAFEEVVGEKNI